MDLSWDQKGLETASTWGTGICSKLSSVGCCVCFLTKFAQQGIQVPGMQLSNRLTYGHSFLRSDIRPIFEVVVLPLLLSLQVQPCQPAQVLSADGFVYSSSTPDTLPVVVSHIGPPVSLLLDIPQNHVLNGGREPWHLSVAQQLSIITVTHAADDPQLAQTVIKLVHINKSSLRDLQLTNTPGQCVMQALPLQPDSASRIHAQ